MLPSPRLTRRGWLQIGSLGMFGAGLPEVLRAEQTAGSKAPNATPKSCIFFFLYGGPAHQDMWDMKPDAPAEIRGEFKPIPTSVPGTRICEHLPRLARVADKFSIVRSVTHKYTQHNAGAYLALTGSPGDRDVVELVARSTDHPAYGAVVSRLSGPALMPVFVSVPAVLKDGVYLTPGQFGGWLGRHYDPLFVESDPSTPTFQVSGLAPAPGVGLERIEQRRMLLERTSSCSAFTAAGPNGQTLSSFQERAFALITSPAARRAFDLTREADRIRDRYGRHTWGQSALLARRLVEGGARMVTIHWSPDFDKNWDTHGGNFKKLKELLLPQLDSALSALLVDLADRGLLEETLVVCMGEFGRTPKVNGGAGRDHWPGCYSVVLAGGGIRGGRIVGRSDKQAAFPLERPVSPQDLAATLYAALGIKPDLEIVDVLNRPRRIVENGMPIHELFSISQDSASIREEP